MLPYCGVAPCRPCPAPIWNATTHLNRRHRPWSVSHYTTLREIAKRWDAWAQGFHSFMERSDECDFTCSTSKKSPYPHITIYALVLEHYTVVDTPCQWCTGICGIFFMLNANVTIHLLNFFFSLLLMYLRATCRLIWLSVYTPLRLKSLMSARIADNSKILLGMSVVLCYMHWVIIETCLSLNLLCYLKISRCHKFHQDSQEKECMDLCPYDNLCQMIMIAIRMCPHILLLRSHQEGLHHPPTSLHRPTWVSRLWSLFFHSTITD